MRKRLRRGFSLIEVMIASSLLVTGLAAVLVGYTSALRTSARLKHLTLASQVAESVIEDLLAASSTSNVLVAGDHSTTNGAPLGFDSEGESTAVADAVYTATWFVTSNRAGQVAFDGMAQILITVSWQGVAGTESTTLKFHRD